MPSTKTAQLVIEHIVSRFLSPKMDYKAADFKTINEILELPIYALKNLDQETAKTYRDVFHLQTIKEFANLEVEHPLNAIIPAQRSLDIQAHLARVEKIMEDARIKIGDMEKLKSTILIARMINNAWAKRNDYIAKKDTKVITVGLDNAGKTAILSSLGGKLGLDTLAKLQPTKRVERRKIQTESLELYLWDFGGQADYRKMYIESPEKFFLRTDLVLYVIDMQDPDRYQESFNYFLEIVQIMERLGESPYILCFLHKSDPDLLNDPDFQVNLEYVQDQLKQMLKKYPFEFDLYVTSIYNFFTTEPKFSKFIKDVLKDQQSLNDPMLDKMAGLGKILETTLNSVLTLSTSISSQISGLEIRITELERKIAETSIMHVVDKQAATNKPSQIAIPTTPSALKQIEDMALASRKNLEQLQLSPPPGTNTQNTPTPAAADADQSKVSQTRASILKELQALIKKAKPLRE